MGYVPLKRTRIFPFAAVLIVALLFSACSYTPSQGGISATPSPSILSPSPGQIYLYGERHGVEKILDREFALWYEYYHNEGMRHLFIENAYYTAEFLNIWMQSDSDDILEELYRNWTGTKAHNPYTKPFFQKIKNECPETVFHGTDVGHQHQTIGKQFLKYLESNNMEGSEQYVLAQEAIEQGRYYYEHSDEAYRENKMAENFIREYDGLSGIKIMGIYGGAHTGLDAMDYTGSVPCMANQLKAYYGDIIQSENLAWLAEDTQDSARLAKVMEPYRVDTIKVNEKNYEASYFGKQELNGFRDNVCREFWRLENAYDDFKNCPKPGDVLPYNNYPMLIETGEVFVIDYTKTDGSVARKFYRSDGNTWSSMATTEEFTAN